MEPPLDPTHVIEVPVTWVRLDVSPSLAAEDGVDRAVCYTELSSERQSCLSSHRLFPDAYHFSRSELCQMDVFTTELSERSWGYIMRSATLPQHVDGIGALGPEKQMVGANAVAYITVVADQQSVGDSPEVDLPRQAMHANRMLPSVVPDVSIPIAGRGACPQPAGGGFQDTAPQPLRCRSRLFLHKGILADRARYAQTP